MSDRLKIKILGLACATRRGRNTSWLVLHALKAAEKFGRRISEIADVETQFIDLANKEIRRCCGNQKFCFPNKGIPWQEDELKDGFSCILKNDYISQLKPIFAESDGFIFGVPVYNHTYTSTWRLLTERLSEPTCRGYFTNKPSGVVTVAAISPPAGGQDNALHTTVAIAQAIETIVVAEGAATSGPPYGPTEAEDDGRMIGAKNDLLGKMSVATVGRRVAEFAVMFKLAKQDIGELYHREFLHHLHPPLGGLSWSWHRLDADDEAYMRNLP